MMYLHSMADDSAMDHTYTSEFDKCIIRCDLIKNLKIKKWKVTAVLRRQTVTVREAVFALEHIEVKVRHLT